VHVCDETQNVLFDLAILNRACSRHSNEDAGHVSSPFSE
jgi:hypothetical protein